MQTSLVLISKLVSCWLNVPLPQLSMEVQFSVAHHIQCLVKSERNRQIMCESGLVSTLLTHCRSVLLIPNHPLHVPITRTLEKLSSQAISSSDFRWDSLSGFYIYFSFLLTCTPRLIWFLFILGSFCAWGTLLCVWSNVSSQNSTNP